MKIYTRLIHSRPLVTFNEIKTMNTEELTKQIIADLKDLGVSETMTDIFKLRLERLVMYAKIEGLEENHKIQDKILSKLGL